MTQNYSGVAAPPSRTWVVVQGEHGAASTNRDAGAAYRRSDKAVKSDM